MFFYSGGEFPHPGDYAEVLYNKNHEIFYDIGEVVRIIEVDDEGFTQAQGEGRRPCGSYPDRFVLKKRTDGFIPESKKMRVIRD